MLTLPFQPSLPVRTERLVLRAFAAHDLSDLLRFHSRPDAVRYVPFEPRNADAMAQALAVKVASTCLRQDGDRLDIAVTRAKDRSVIGDLVLMLTSTTHHSVEVGYLFDPAVGGRGYATEAVAACLDLAFLAAGAHRVTATVDTRNARSLALCRRLGLRQEAHLVDNVWFKGEWASQTIHAVLDHEWRARRDATHPAAPRPA